MGWRGAIGVILLVSGSSMVVAQIDAHTHFERDYMLTSDAEARLDYGITMMDNCDPCWGGRVQYRAFHTANLTFAARRYDGYKVTLIIPDVHPRQDHVTPTRLRSLVDRLDLLYTAYAELLNWEPIKVADPLGKQVFALLPNEPDWFYGVALLGGDSTEYNNSVIAETQPDDDILSNVWVHELAHNFDPIRIWDYGPDPAHDWTTLIQTWFAKRQVQGRESRSESWRHFEQGWRNIWLRFLGNDALNWELCAAQSPPPEACQQAEVWLLSGLLGVEVSRHVDGAHMKAWLADGFARQRSGATFTTPQAKSDDMLATLARVTQTDTRCLADFAKWHRGSALDVVASVFPNPFHGCVDGDNDGVSWQQDDCDDNDASVYPGAPEIPDGRDNNCNGIVDEVVFDESSVAGGDFPDDVWNGAQVPAPPVVIRGVLKAHTNGTTDRDSIRLTQALRNHATWQLCSTGVALGLTGIQNNGVAYGPIAASSVASCGNGSSTDAVWTGFWVDSMGAAVQNDVAWSLTLAERLPSEDDFDLRPRLEVSLSNGAIRAQTAGIASLPSGPGVELRWWRTGEGFVKTLPVSNSDAWTAPPTPAASFTTSGRPVQLRAQLWKDGMPISEPSRPYLIEILDEPGAMVNLSVTPGLSCPGFYRMQVLDGPGPGGHNGSYGAELLLNPPGRRLLAGGLNFGGAIDAQARGYAGFTIANATNEPQLVNLQLTGLKPGAAGQPISLRVLMQRRSPDEVVILDIVTTVTNTAAYQTQVTVPPGFYSISVEPRTDPQPGGAADARFAMSVTTRYTNRPGGGFQGGAVVGGYHDASLDMSGFAAVCLTEPHTVRIRTEGAPTRGPNGARDLRLRILDATGVEVYSSN